MAEYTKQYKNENPQGFTLTLTPSGRYPITGSRIFATKSDLDTWLALPDGVAGANAIAGITVSVVADSTPANNGQYEIRFVNTSLTETVGGVTYVAPYYNGTVNLTAIKITNSNDFASGLVTYNIESVTTNLPDNQYAIYKFRKYVGGLEQYDSRGDGVYMDGSIEIPNLVWHNMRGGRLVINGEEEEEEETPQVAN